MTYTLCGAWLKLFLKLTTGEACEGTDDTVYHISFYMVLRM